jgi:NTP pyrophosphatase (non-canonical NTP hydrolase)
MTFDEYQKKALTTALFKNDATLDATIWALGIAGESSEIAEKWKKILAYDDGVISDESRTELAKELGDVIWYVALMAHQLGLSFDEIMQMNLDKLASRKARGAIKGRGDNR